MSITIKISEETERILAERAARYGQSLETYASTLLKRESRAKTIDEILEPFRRSFEESGMTEDQLDEFVDQIRKDIYREQHGAKK